jgi:diaminopropionate ammonia-lyase
MNRPTKWVVNHRARREGAKASLALFTPERVQSVRAFHRGFPRYGVTPLSSLPNLAGRLGVAGVYVKDESCRFGLQAFKVLGGSYAIGRYLAGRLGVDLSRLPFPVLAGPETRARLGVLTFTSATDGNHGRGVAWAARRLGHRAVIYMPKGSSRVRLENIREAGGEASITDLNYDDAVRLAAAHAAANGWVVVQDTAWEGYSDIPAWIMQGYATMAAEALEQLRAAGVAMPTHILIQAGVGSLAGAMVGFFAAAGGAARPLTAVVEPDRADCIYRSALAGEPRSVTGHMDTIMAGLACGEPNPLSWPILWDYADLFISCPDEVTALGMRVLGNPLGDDPRVVSGESGAVTTGILAACARGEGFAGLRSALGLDAGSRVLVFSTEGDTDPAAYRRIVWDGHYGLDCPGARDEGKY